MILGSYQSLILLFGEVGRKPRLGPGIMAHKAELSPTKAQLARHTREESRLGISLWDRWVREQSGDCPLLKC